MISADETVSELEALVARRGRAPAFLRCDNGPELTSHALRDWCRFEATQTAFIEPGAPWQNPFVESFHARVRDELLNTEQFACLAEARVVIADWREDYNTRRPHSALGMRTPASFAAEWTHPSADDHPGETRGRIAPPLGSPIGSPPGRAIRPTSPLPSWSYTHRLSQSVGRRTGSFQYGSLRGVPDVAHASDRGEGPSALA